MRCFSKGVIIFHSSNYYNYYFLQLWDVRDGICKQTFTGHESDINAVTVSLVFNTLDENWLQFWFFFLKSFVLQIFTTSWSCCFFATTMFHVLTTFSFTVLPQWERVCHWVWWRHLQALRHQSWSRAQHGTFEYCLKLNKLTMLIFVTIKGSAWYVWVILYIHSHTHNQDDQELSMVVWVILYIHSHTHNQD